MGMRVCYEGEGRRFGDFLSSRTCRLEDFFVEMYDVKLYFYKLQ